MLPIIELTNILQGTMTNANIKIFLELTAGFFFVRCRITTRSLSRYTSYSLRQIFRFLKQNHCWLTIRLTLFNHFIYNPDNHYVIAVDETVEGKSGRKSFGLGRFYSSCIQKSIPGICFFGLSLLDVGNRTSYLIDIAQVFYTEEDRRRIAANKKKICEGKARSKRGENLPKGRRKGTKNKQKPSGEIQNQGASFRTFRDMWQKSMEAVFKITPRIRITHLLADSAYGTSCYMALAAEHNCALISKMNRNAALYACPEPGKSLGRPRIYGQRYNLLQPGRKYLKQSKTENGILHEIYQFEARSKSIKGVKLNTVLLSSTRKDGKKSSGLWFSNDLTLDFETMIDYYSLRFQIEFDFRDAKQHFGFSDFKNYQQQNLTNFVNLSFTMCLISKILLASHRKKLRNEKISILDLKIIFNARFTAKKIIKLLRLPDNNIFYSRIIDHYVPDEIINAH